MNGTAAAVPAASTLYVDAQGNGNYTTIQGAVNNASSGDTILVYPGTYTENVNASVENISIRSFSGNPDDTIVKRLCVLSHTFKITANNVTISGFNITGEHATGIYMNGVSGANITDNEFSGVDCGVQMEKSSRCSLIDNTVNGAVQHGFYLSSSSNNCILTNNTISYTGEEGILLKNSINCILTNNTVSRIDSEGILVKYSNGCTLINNAVTDANSGISLDSSDECVLRNNRASSGIYGISLSGIQNCTFTGNIMSGNWYNFNLELYDLENKTGNVIDTSNLVDGNKIYYFEGEPKPSIKSDAGTVYCINCGKAEIKDLVLQNNSYGVFLYNTSSEMQNNTINNSVYGIMVLSSHNVNISDSRVENSMMGVNLKEVTDVTLADNVVKNSICGMATVGCENCTLTCNYIQGSINNNCLLSSENSRLVRGGENSLIRESTLINPNLVQVSRPFIFGIFSLNSQGLKLENNSVDTGLEGIYLDGCQNARIVRNSVRNIEYMGIYSEGSSSVELLDNTVQNMTGELSLYTSGNSSFVSSPLVSSPLVGKGQAPGYGICFVNSEDVRLKGNTVKDCCPVWGIYLLEPVDATLESNTLQNCKGGLVTILSENLSVNDCSVTNCTSGGILVINPEEGLGTGYTVADCTVEGSNIGMLVTGEGTLSGNTLSGNLYGLILYDVNNSLICGNTIVQNSLAGLAFDLEDSKIMSHSGLVKSIESPESGNNTIYNNYFNNTNNTLIKSGANNAWNKSKTAGENIVGGPYLGGNYWANPNGTGFSENCIDADRDGIADSSYEIVSGTFDYLPLTNISSAPIFTTTHRHKSSTKYVPSIGESTGVTGIDISQKKVVAGSRTSFRFSDPVSGVLGLSFTPQQCSGNVIVRIEVLGNGSSVETPEGEVYKLMNIQVGNERFERGDNINGASINFRVSRSWTEENNIDVSTITMNRFHDDEWNALPTKMTGEDEEFYYFSAETPGFSRYAVTGDKIGAGNTQGTEIITPVKEEKTAATGDEQTKDKKAPGFESTLAVLGVLSSLFFVKKRI